MSYSTHRRLGDEACSPWGRGSGVWANRIPGLRWSGPQGHGGVSVAVPESSSPPGPRSHHRRAVGPAHHRVDQVPVMELRISVQHHDDHATIQLGGEVDRATCPQLRAVLVELIDRGFHQLTIDLEQVGFLDCTGIGVLVDALRRVEEHDGRLELVRPRPFVRRVLTLTGMAALLPAHTLDGEALTTDPA